MVGQQRFSLSRPDLLGLQPSRPRKPMVRCGRLGKTSDMESYEGNAALEWWANRSSCLGGFGIRVTITTGSDSGWLRGLWPLHSTPKSTKASTS